MSRKNFTIIEVVAALTILTTAITALLALTITAQQRMIKSAEQHKKFHMLQQAVEYYMLQPEEYTMIPSTIFDYGNYEATCLVDTADTMDEDLNDTSSLIQLDAWVISIVDTSTYEKEVVESICIERLHYDD